MFADLNPLKQFKHICGVSLSSPRKVVTYTPQIPHYILCDLSQVPWQLLQVTYISEFSRTLNENV